MVPDKIMMVAGLVTAVAGIATAMSDFLEIYEPHLAKQRGGARIIEARAFDNRYNPFVPPTRPSRQTQNDSVHPNKSGVCRICRSRAKTDWHHIISQGYAKRNGEEHLIDNPGNMVEICRNCHEKTTSWHARRYLDGKENRSKNRKNRRFWDRF